MLRTNRDKLVKISVQGKIQHPGKNQDYVTDGEGLAHSPTATGGICYNVKVGDRCMDLAADHTEPGVTTSNEEDAFSRKGYSTYTCIGNEARVVAGDAKGRLGYVTGKHDLSNVMIYFDDDTLEMLSLDDKILVKGYGQGLKLPDYPDIHVMNIDPDLFERLGVAEKDGRLVVPVAKRIPPFLMGSGMGMGSVYSGDYDIMTQDKNAVRALGLEDLRFGDLVLLEDCDSTYGRGYFKGAVTIGVIIHGDCLKPGHGPGVTTILSSRSPLLQGEISENANIAAYHPLTRDGFLGQGGERGPGHGQQ